MRGYRQERGLRARRMMDDLDEDDDHRWSLDMTQETKRTGRRAEIWMDGRTRGYTFLPNPQAESVFKACSAFAFELK